MVYVVCAGGVDEDDEDDVDVDDVVDVVLNEQINK